MCFSTGIWLVGECIVYFRSLKNYYLPSKCMFIRYVNVNGYVISRDLGICHLRDNMKVTTACPFNCKGFSCINFIYMFCWQPKSRGTPIACAMHCFLLCALQTKRPTNHCKEAFRASHPPTSKTKSLLLTELTLLLQQASISFVGPITSTKIGILNFRNVCCQPNAY